MLHADLHDPDLLAEEGEEFNPEAGLLRGGDVRPAVPDAHILQRDMEAREEADPQPAADADFHPQGVGGGRLQPGLVRVHIHEEKYRDRGQDEKRKEPAGREEGEFSFAGHADQRPEGRRSRDRRSPTSRRTAMSGSHGGTAPAASDSFSGGSMLISRGPFIRSKYHTGKDGWSTSMGAAIRAAKPNEIPYIIKTGP